MTVVMTSLLFQISVDDKPKNLASGSNTVQLQLEAESRGQKTQTWLCFVYGDPCGFVGSGEVGSNASAVTFRFTITEKQ